MKRRFAGWILPTVTTFLVIFHLVSTGALLMVMIEAERGGTVGAQSSIEIMRLIATSICGQVPARRAE